MKNSIKQFTRAAFVALVVVFMLGALLVLPANANNGNGQGGEPATELCQESGKGWQDKVDTSDDEPFTYTAPEGYLVDGYCAKAGTTINVVTFEPVGSVFIEHDEKDSLSHYQVRLVPAPTPSPSPEPSPSPTETPSPEPSPSVTPTPEPTPTDSPSPSVTTEPQEPGDGGEQPSEPVVTELPNTGPEDALLIGVLGISLLGAGAWLTRKYA